MKVLTFLFLIFYFIPAFAEFKIEVKNLEGKVIGGSEFQTRYEAEAWLSSQAAVEAFGKNERLVPLDGASDEDRALAIEVIPANEETQTPSMLRLRKTYSYTITDVSAERQAEVAARAAKIQERQEAIEKLKLGCADVDSASTIANLRAAVKACLTNIIKANKVVQ